MIDKEFCAASYLAFRYIEKENVDFYTSTKHQNIPPTEGKYIIKTAKDIDDTLTKVFDNLKGKRLGLLLSGGMDSAILASYMKGCNAYTFRFLDGQYQSDELKRAEFYANKYQLSLHYVDISWSTVEKYLQPLMIARGQPVHSIEPQICQAACEALNDHVDTMVVGESADLLFGGMDGLLSKDWTFDEFVERYNFTDPKKVLQKVPDYKYLYEKFRKGNYIDLLGFMDHVFSTESSSSYWNAFRVANMPYVDPYAGMRMGIPLDLGRVRSGDSKYLIRELFHIKYPDMKVPEKVPMPRPVNQYFANWRGPTRYEFRKDIKMNEFTGNQKWQMYCLEQFFNLYESERH